jgi:hypothetical protein
MRGRCVSTATAAARSSRSLAAVIAPSSHSTSASNSSLSA